MSFGITKEKITYGELFYFLFFALMFGMRMWGIYESRPLYIPLLIAGMLMWGLSIVLRKHTLFEYMIMAIFMGISCIVYYNTGEKGLILYFALMLGMKAIDEKKLFKVGFTVGIIGTTCLTCLVDFGIIEDIADIE